MIRPTNAARRIDTEALKRERPLADVIASYGVTLRRESAGTSAHCARSTRSTPRASGSTRATPADSTISVSAARAHGDVDDVRHGARGLLLPGGVRTAVARAADRPMEPERSSPHATGAAGNSWPTPQARALEGAGGLRERSCGGPRARLEYLRARAVSLKSRARTSGSAMRTAARCSRRLRRRVDDSEAL